MDANLATAGRSRGAALKRYRLQAGLTQEELAEAGGISVRSVSDIERGRQNPSPRTARNLADALGLKGDERTRFVAELTGADCVDRTEHDGSGHSRRHRSLPTPITDLIGRERDLAEIHGLLNEEATRLLVLTGPGGVGKTRLAVEVGCQAENKFEVVAFASLAPVTAVDNVMPSIAAALGATADSGQDQVESISALLGDRRALLIVDNFEHVLSAAPELLRLLSQSSRLVVLCTSRELLHVYGERVYPVPRLQVKNTQSDPDSSCRSPSDAARLFARRAAMVYHHFRITPDNYDTVEEICRRLDGLPLALELAAARTNSLSEATVLDGLSKTDHIHAPGPAAIDARHESLQTTIDWSYGLLEWRERRLLRRLSVFRGGFTLEAATAVADPAADRDEVLLAMNSLVDKCLVERDERDDCRYSLLETLRQYAYERFQDVTDGQEVLMRHAQYYGKWLEELHRADSLVPWQRYFDLMDWEKGNIEAAMQHARESDDTTLAFHILSLQLLLRLETHADPWPAWSKSMPDGVEEPVRTRVLMLGRSIWQGPTFDDTGRRRSELLLSPAELMRTEKPPLAPWLLTSIGALMTFYGSRSRDYWKEGGQAERYFSSSRDSLDNTDSSRFTGAALRGIIHATDLFGGDLCRAEAALEDVMAIERGRGDVLGVVWTLNSLAHIRVRRGHYREAFAQFEELAAGYRKAGFDREVAESELQLLILAIAAGWHEEADRRMVRFLAHQRDLAYRLLTHLAVGFYACSAAARGMAREAALIVGANSAHCAASQLADSLHWCEVGDFELAAQSCDGDWEWYGVESYPVHDTFVRVMRDLGEEEYRRLRRQGSRMILEEAVGMILHVNDPAVEAQLLASD